MVISIAMPFCFSPSVLTLNEPLSYSYAGLHPVESTTLPVPASRSPRIFFSFPINLPNNANSRSFRFNHLQLAFPSFSLLHP
jgi:hypothetical protein